MAADIPLITTGVSWERLLESHNEVRFLESQVLPSFMMKCRWFGGKAKTINRAVVQVAIPVKVSERVHFLLVIEVEYAQRLPEQYFLPVTFVPDGGGDSGVEETLQSVVCRASVQGATGLILDSSYDRQFRDFLFLSMQRNARLEDRNGVLEFHWSTQVEQEGGVVESRILKADQSNTAILYGDRYFFKFYRKVDAEINSELEIIRFLSERTSFRQSPRYIGSMQHRKIGNPVVFGLLQRKVDNLGDAWVMCLEALDAYYDAVLKLPKGASSVQLIEGTALGFDDAPATFRELIGRRFFDLIVQLGQRTADMHIALASDHADPAFAPEALTREDQHLLYSSLRTLMDDRFELLRDALPRLDQPTQALAGEVLSFAGPILESFAKMKSTPIPAIKTRIHGDYHLGQVLFTGDDFVIIDFEGEPGLSFSERRVKKSPLKDVAGMMRSFHYAAYGKILLNRSYRVHDPEILERAAEQWQHYVTRFFLGAYLKQAGLAVNLSEENRILIRTFLLEKAIYELGYELNARPDWVNVPLRGIHYLVTRYLQERA